MRGIAGMDEDRANSLLDDLIADGDMELTDELIEGAGGRGEVLAAALSE